jgi:RimJ/RimL family protein N-acetyltransferase
MEMFAQHFWDDVFAQFVIQSRRTGEVIGHCLALDADLHSGHVNIGVVVRPTSQRSSAGLQGLCLLVHYLFETGPFRKIYADTLEYSISQFRSAEGVIFEREGVLRDHHYFSGRYWDKYLLAIYRDRWYESGVPLLQALL